MSPAQALLLRVTSAQWLKMDDDARAVVLDAIHEVVPSTLLLASLVGHAPKPFPFFLHQPTKVGFFLVFGQRFSMGVTDEQLRRARAHALQEYEDDDDGVPTVDGSVLRPRRVVDVAPFFAGEAELSDAVLSGLGDRRAPPKKRTDTFELHGWRLPSEAELDLLRTVSSVSELERLDSGLCADDWHDELTGAPERGTPWGAGEQVYRGLDQWRRPWRVFRRRDDRYSKLRPFFSLFDDALGYGEEAIAARAAEPPLRANEFWDQA